MADDPFRTVQDNYDQAFEINTAIVGFTRKKVLELRELAEKHRECAEKYDEIADTLCDFSLQSAELIAHGIAVEAGLIGDDDPEGEGDE